MPEIPPHLHERYGIRPPSKLRFVWAALGVVTIGFVAVYFVSRFYTTRNAEAALIEWSTLTDTRISLTIQANADDSDRWCAVRAQSFDQFDVGFVVIPISAPAQKVVYDMNTLEPPFAVDVVGCAKEPTRIFGPQFPPGVLPPAQDEPGLAPGIWQ